MGRNKLLVKIKLLVDAVVHRLLEPKCVLAEGRIGKWCYLITIYIVHPATTRFPQPRFRNRDACLKMRFTLRWMFRIPLITAASPHTTVASNWYRHSSRGNKSLA
jgi:hypothetical protein